MQGMALGVGADLHGDRFVREFYPAAEDKVSDVPGITGRDGGIELHWAKSQVLRAQEAYWEKPLQPDKGHAAMLDDIADALLEGAPMPSSEVDGARATLMAPKALDSIRADAPVHFLVHRLVFLSTVKVGHLSWVSFKIVQFVVIIPIVDKPPFVRDDRALYAVGLVAVGLEEKGIAPRDAGVRRRVSGEKRNKAPAGEVDRAFDAAEREKSGFEVAVRNELVANRTLDATGNLCPVGTGKRPCRR